MNKVAISIVHYNNDTATNACLQSLKEIKNDIVQVSVFVVDNGSKIPYIVPKDFPFSIQLLRSETNTGFSGGQNIGIQHALKHDADFILILNNDTLVDVSFLENLVTSFQQHTSAGIISPKIYYAAGSEYHKDRYSKDQLGNILWYAGGMIDWQNISGKHRGVDQVDTGQFDTAEQISFATGCCMLIKKEVIDKVGMFDDRYFLYYEDADFCERIKKNGFSLWYEPKSYIWHKNAEASGGSGSSLQEYYVSRNRMLFGFSYGTLRIKFALFRESIRLLIKGRTWQKRGIQDFYFHRFGKSKYSFL